MHPDKMLTLKNAYEACGVSRRTWYNWLNRYPKEDRQSWKAPGLNGMRTYTRQRVIEIAADNGRTPNWDLIKEDETS